MNPARCRIVAVGKVRRGWIQDGIDLYLKRLPGFSITELRDSSAAKEAEAIRSAIRSDETLIVLMEQGDVLASIPFAKRPFCEWNRSEDVSLFHQHDQGFVRTNG